MGFPKANLNLLNSERELLTACTANPAQLLLSFRYDSKDPLEILLVEDLVVSGAVYLNLAFELPVNGI